MLENAWEVLIPWLISAGILAAVVVAMLLVHSLVYRLLADLVSHTSSSLDDSFVGRGRKPAKLILPLLAAIVTLGTLPLPRTAIGPLRHIVGLALIGATAWLAISLLGVIDDAVELKFRIDVKDNLAARRVQTQGEVLERNVTGGSIIVNQGSGRGKFP